MSGVVCQPTPSQTLLIVLLFACRFCAAIFIIGNGLGSLETAANPYITVCGPPRYSEMRINLAQAFNGIGTVLAPVLGSYVIFNKVGDSKKAIGNVQWIYLAIACFCLLLVCIFYLYEDTFKDCRLRAD